MTISGWMFLLGALGGTEPVQDRVTFQRVPDVVLKAAKAQRKLPDPGRYAATFEEALGPDVDIADLLSGSDLNFQPVVGFTPTTTAGAVTMAVTASAANLTTAPSETQRIYGVTLHPGTGSPEHFLIAPAPAGALRPLLVGFHKFGVSHYDVLYHTSFFQEGIQRGWHVIAPWGGHSAHFSNIVSQLNTEAVLNWVIANFGVDKTRVYGVGFSMGGGAALNYAARHVDPDGVMFAGIVNHTGTVDLLDAYANEPGAQQIFDNLFGNGNPGSADNWLMRRSSLITLDPVTQQVDTATDLARNLSSVSTRTVYASQDPKAYLRTQNSALHARLVSLFGATSQHGLYVFPGNTHDWATLNAKSSCDWLRTRRLKIPDWGYALADQQDVYFYFDIEQDQGNAFTPFRWNLDPPTNAVAITNTATLMRVSVNYEAAGLSTLTPLTVVLSTSDGIPDTVRFRNWDHLPSNVLRDGVATTSWAYETGSGALSLIEYDGAAQHVWQVIP